MGLSKRHSGFTLVEVVVVVALIALLATIAIPSYKEHVKKTRRVDAESVLVGFASALERYYSVNNTYVAPDAGSDADGLIPSPAIYPSEAPLGGGAKFYDLRMQTTARTYTVIAVPKGDQKSDGRLRLDSVGQKAWDKEDDGSWSGNW